MITEQDAETNPDKWLHTFVPDWLASFNSILANTATPNHVLVLKLEVMRVSFPRWMHFGLSTERYM